MKIWYEKHPLRFFLLPVAWLYHFAIMLRKLFYQVGFKKTYKLPVPVIIVGNITIGGTGKTPCVAWLYDYLKANNYKPGIVSRGYRGKKNHVPQLVCATSMPQEVGDEPVMLMRQLSCPIAVGRNRVKAAKELLANTDCNIIISDDGLAHYALARDIEIVVIDGMRRFGNNLLLPAGPLREPKSRLHSVNFLIANGEALQNEYLMQINPGTIYQINNFQKKLDLTRLAQKKVHAIAGIGNPERFFQQLRSMGITIVPHAFPDHYPFSAQDIDFGDEAIVIMTEKDAVKCLPFADKRHWCLPVHAELPVSFSQRLLERLQNLQNSVTTSVE